MDSSGTQVARFKPGTGEDVFTLAIRNSHLGTGKSVAIRGHRFQNWALMKDAEQHAEGFLQAHSNGFLAQAQRHLEKIYNIVLTDQAHQVVRIANKAGLFSKVFAICDQPTTLIKSREHDWSLREMSGSSDDIPAAILKGVGRLRDAGIVFDGYALATPHGPPPSSMLLPALRRAVDLIFRDPVLLGYKTGKDGYSIYVELGRFV